MEMEESTMTSSLPPIPDHILIKCEYSSDTSSDGGESKGTNIKPRQPENLPLVDEIDLQQCLVSPRKSWHASAIQGVVIGKKQLELMCNHAKTNEGAAGFQACPCCRRFVRVGGNNSLCDIESGDDAAMKSFVPMSSQAKNENKVVDIKGDESGDMLTSLWTSITSIQSPMAAPPLVTGDKIQNYTITETIVQGWLYKKATGDDFSGRRWWKPRWVTLALAESPTTLVPTPCLLSHRAPGVPYPASIIELTPSTVIMAIERTRSSETENKQLPGTSDREEWNRHCFQIVHAHNQDGESQKTTRIFTAPASERNEWVFVLNNALLAYEKRLSKARSNTAKNMSGELVEKQMHDKELQGQLSRTKKGCGSTMRSLSPLRGTKASMIGGGLPPSNPRRGVKSPTVQFDRRDDAS